MNIMNIPTKTTISINQSLFTFEIEFWNQNCLIPRLTTLAITSEIMRVEETIIHQIEPHRV